MRKQQRFVAVVGISFDRAQKDDVVAAIIAVDGAALKICHALCKQWRAAKSRSPFDTDKFII